MFKYPGRGNNGKHNGGGRKHKHNHHHHQNRPVGATMGPPPPMTDLRRWFDYYDRDRGGSLDREEVVNALIQTQRSASPGHHVDERSIRETVYNVWTVFDHDGNGYINRSEFVSRGGMGESLIATMNLPSAPPTQQYPSGVAAAESEVNVPPLPPAYAPNAGAGAPNSSGGNTWGCPRCSFLNATTSNVCQACRGPRPFTGQQQQHQQQNTTSTTQMMRVTIPPAMTPGQQLRVQTAQGPDQITTIPERKRWQYSNGVAFFEMPMPVAVVTASAVPVSPNATIVPGTIISGARPAAVAPAPPTVHGAYNETVSQNGGVNRPQQQQQWQSWENFRGHGYEPVPLGMQSVQFTTDPNATVPPSGRRRALIIGINYKGTRAALRGCVNDAQNMKKLLTRHGFPDDSTHMVMLIDEGGHGRHGRGNGMPTKANILRAFQWLVHGASAGDALFFHFSGHGAQQADTTGHEADGYNETILPLDYRKEGQITDDVIWNSIVYPLPSGVRLTAVMDCCHSGTGLDLPYEYNLLQRRWVEDINPAHTAGDVVLFSGCEDSQTSADAFDRIQRTAGGAMTQAFLEAYEKNPYATYPQFMDAIHKNLRKRKFTQRPQLTTSQQFHANSRVFSFVDGIEPNRNKQVGRCKRRHIRPGKKHKHSLLNELLFGGGGTGVALAIGVGALLNEVLS